MAKHLLRSALARNPLLNEFYLRAQRIEPCDAAHDFSHVERVAALAIQILTEEIHIREKRVPSFQEVDDVAVAALLHDCVPVPKNSPLRKQSSTLASEKAREWLTEANWPKSSIETIAFAVRDHSYSAGFTPSSLVGESLQDADRLESLGALGLYRTLATGVSMGAKLFDAEDPWAERRPLDDVRYSVDHFFNKLFKLPAGFRTQAARDEANRRADFLHSFIKQLKSEID